MNMTDYYRGKTAVITGAAGGLGKGLAQHACKLGMNVVLADKAVESLDQTSRELEGLGGIVLAVPTDVTDPQAVEALAERATDRFGPIHLLINNAGIETLGFSWEIPAHTWALAVNVNLLGVVYCASAFARRMIDAGQPAQIANVASLASLGSMAVTAPYMATKHGVLAFTESLKLELALKQAPIDVSVIVPGPVATSIFVDAPGVDADPMVDEHRKIMTAMLAQQGITPSEAASLIFDQLERKQFWVSTHLSVTQAMAKQRAAYLAALDTPVLGEETRMLLGQ